MKTVIMAGGKGTRIQSVEVDVPKPMIKIAGKPILEHEIIALKFQGFTDIIITVSYLGNSIKDYFGNGDRFGVNIEYFDEEYPLGNAGALFKLRDRLQDSFLLLNADIFFDVDLNRMIRFHKEKGGWVTLFTHPNSHPYDSGLIICNTDSMVEKWLTKEDARPPYYANRVNGGIHVIDPVILGKSGIDPKIVGEMINGNRMKVDLDRQLLRPLAGTGKMYAYNSPEYVKDMGTPDRFYQVKKDFESGIIDKKNLRNKQKAVFLDRDGTINKYVGFLRHTDQFELLDGVAEAIQIINSHGYLCIVVTNQPVIARGEVSRTELDEIHNKMETLLGYQGSYIDALYYCPHHPDRGFKGEIEELKTDCNCRKPKPGMLLKAAEDYNIDLSASFMVGDRQSDIQAGKASGCRTVLIGEQEYGQDITVNNLLEFTRLLSGSQKII